MLLGYGAKNCWSFKDWFQINLETDKSIPTDVSMNLPALTAMCFKGANASGKSNGLKVLAFLSDFAKTSFQYSPQENILFDSFFNNEEISEFYIEFEVSGAYFRYELEATNKAVKIERLFRKKAQEGSRETLVFERNDNKIVKNNLYKGHSDILFRDNASFISTLAQHAIPEIKDIYNFFVKIEINMSYIGVNDFGTNNQYLISAFYNKNSESLSFTSSKIKMFDTGIESIEIKSMIDQNNEQYFYPVFYHKTQDNKILPLQYNSESNGTKALFGKLAQYYSVLKNGGVLVLDELDANLHPDILPYLLDLFLVKDKNTNNAQILFTSHNNDIMDLLGRYRNTLFVKEENESFCYRLDEPKAPYLRNDRPVSVPYKKHLIGGYPKIGN